MKNKLDINIRQFTTQDRSICGELFYQTVHAICSKDYEKDIEQGLMDHLQEI